jgi:nucleoside-diphosphate-sugar epimerase
LGLLAHGVPGEVYNVCSGQPYTLQTVLDELTNITGHELDVCVNPAFVRANEVHRLCGDPAKLLACVGPLRQPALRETLMAMLASADAGGAP